MAGIIKSSWRIENINATQTNTVLDHYFRDTKPSVIQIKNLSNSNIYISTKPNLSTTEFMLQIGPLQTRIFTYPPSTDRLYYLVDNVTNFILSSAEATEIYPSDLDTTQAVSLLQSVNIGSSVTVDSIQKPLPAGTNNIGKIDVNSLPSLPAGANNIGKVDINSLPPLPAGANNIGKVDINSLPSLPTGANNIGKVDINSIPSATAQKITLTANTQYTVKSSTGIVIKIQTSLTDLQILDNGIEIWKSGSVDFGNYPLQCNTNIVLNSATGGDVYIQYV